MSPRTAQAAMRHSRIDLTMNVYTDPKLLDVAGALDALPELPLASTAAVTQSKRSVKYQACAYRALVDGRFRKIFHLVVLRCVRRSVLVSVSKIGGFQA